VDVSHVNSMEEIITDWGYAQFSYGFIINEGVSGGISYTFGLSKSTASARSMNVSFRSQINPTASDSAWQANQGYSNIVNKIVSHTVKGGIAWDHEGSLLDIVGTVEFLSGDLSVNQHAEQAYHD